MYDSRVKIFRRLQNLTHFQLLAMCIKILGVFKYKNSFTMKISQITVHTSIMTSLAITDLGKHRVLNELEKI